MQRRHSTATIPARRRALDARHARAGALGWTERVERSEIAAFEAASAAPAMPSYRVFERWPDGQAAPADDWLIVIRFIEPRTGNVGRSG